MNKCNTRASKKEQNEKNNNELRQSGIELLRIVATIGVIVLHYNNPMIGGGLKYSKGANNILLYILESLCVCAVNLFVIINGYFDINHNKRDLIKPLHLILQVIVFNEMHYFAKCLQVGHFSVIKFINNFIPTNWFVIIYCALYVCSPFINIVIKNLSKQHYKLLIKILIVTFSIYPTLVDLLEEILQRNFYGLSTVGMYGSQYGYTIINFIIMYIIGAYLRMYGDNKSSSNIVISLICNTIAIAFLGYVDTLFNFENIHVERNAWEYCNPLVILQAVLIFDLFRKVVFYNRYINKLAKASFSVYLIHGYFINHLGIKKIVLLQIPFITLVHLICCSITIFLIGFFVNILYTFIQNYIDKIIFNKWTRHRTFAIGK